MEQVSPNTAPTDLDLRGSEPVRRRWRDWLAPPQGRRRGSSSGAGTPHHPGQWPANGDAGRRSVRVHPPDDEQRFHQYRQVGKVLDKLLDPRLELHLADHSDLRPKLRKVPRSSFSMAMAFDDRLAGVADAAQERRQLRRTKRPGQPILQFFIPKLFSKTAVKPDEIPSKRRVREVVFLRVSTGSKNFFGYLKSVTCWSRAECVGDPRSMANQ